MSNIRTEIIAGLVTFSTMATVLCVQPSIMSGQWENLTPTGMNLGALLTTTCLATAVPCIIMGLWAKYPVALAPGMGMNLLFVTSVIPACAVALGRPVGSDSVWQLALGTVFVSGLLFFVLAILRMCSTMIQILSPSLKSAMGAGLGLFIAFYGLLNAGIVTFNDSSLAIGNLFTPSVLISTVGLIACVVLLTWNVPGALLIAVIVSAGVAYGYQEISFSEGVVGMPANPMPILGKLDILGTFAHLQELWPTILILAFLDVFGCFATVIGVLVNNNTFGSKGASDLPRSERVFMTDALGTMIGTFCGHSSVTSYLESASGIESGGRTGLTACVVGILFLLSLFFSPIILAIAQCNAICAAPLIIVGIMMFQSVKEIDWNDYTEATPAFLIITGMVLTNDITNGIILGLVIYPVVKLLSGRIRDVHPGLWFLDTALIGYLFLKYYSVVSDSICNF